MTTKFSTAFILLVKLQTNVDSVHNHNYDDCHLIDFLQNQYYYLRSSLLLISYCRCISYSCEHENCSICIYHLWITSSDSFASWYFSSTQYLWISSNQVPISNIQKRTYIWFYRLFTTSWGNRKISCTLKFL